MEVISMKFLFKSSITFILLIAFTFVPAFETDTSAAPSGGPGMMQKIKALKQAIQNAKNQGIDTAKAEEADRKSFQAAKSGDNDTAARLIDEALETLQGASKNTANTTNTGKQIEPGQVKNQRPAFEPGRRQGGDRRPDMMNRRGRDQKKPEEAKSGEQEKPKVKSSEFQEPATGEKPVFVMAFTHHYEGPGGYYAKAEEVRRIAEFFHKHKIPGTLFFDGVLVDRLKKEDPGIFEFVNSYKLPLGYHGDETHGPYPVGSDLCAETYYLKEAQNYKGQWSITTGKKWDDAVREVTERYSYFIPYTVDENTRMLERKNSSATDKSRKGGLKLVQEAFGRDVSMMPSHALESAPEGYAFRKMSGFGFDQPAVPIALHALKIFKVADAADTIMGIAGKNVSIFWHMGRIICKGDDMGEASWHPPYINKLNRLDRNEPRLLVMGFSKIVDDAAGETVKYLNERFFPANPGSKWVSGDTLAENFEPEKSYKPTGDDLSLISEYILKNWKACPPDMIEAGSRKFSLTDGFEALARSLCAYKKTGSLPESVSCEALYGPITESGDAFLNAPAEFSLSAIAGAAENICYNWDSSKEDRFVPPAAAVDGKKLNPAEMLYAMASAFESIKKGQGGSIKIGPSSAYPPYAACLDLLFKPKADQPSCYTKGQLWTVKPVRLLNEKPEPGKFEKTTGDAVPVHGNVPPANKTEKIEMVFASNLESSGGCYREDASGADLFRVTFDPGTKKASDLKRLTSSPSKAEWFPALSPDGSYAAYNLTDTNIRGPRGNEIRIIDMKKGSDDTLCGESRFPCFCPDGKNIIFSFSKPGSHQIIKASFEPSGGRMGLGQKRVIADERHGSERVEDPSVSPDGSWIVFHRKEGKGGAGLGFIKTDGTAFSAITRQAGFGHAAVNPDGKTVVCSNSKTGGLSIVSKTGETFSEPAELPLSLNAADFVKYDARFSTVAKACHTYTDWIGKDLLMVSTQGGDEQNKFHFSRIFLLKFQNFQTAPEIIDISSAIEELAGKKSKDFCTASGRYIE